MEPLNLPRGSVRAILTIVLLGLVGAMLFVPLAAGAGDIKNGIVVLAGIAVRDYFQSRETQTKHDGPVLPDPVINP